MKILQIIPDLRVGGAERVAINLCKGFLDSGHTVQLIACKQGGPQEENLPKDKRFSLKILGVKRSSLFRPLSFFRDIKNLNNQLEESLRKFQPDIVQTHLPEDDIIVSRVCKKTGIGAHIPIIHSLKFHIHRKDFDLRSRLRLLLHRKSLQRSARIIAVSQSVKEKIIALTKINPDSVEVLHNGIDLSPYKDLESKEKARQNIKLNNSDKIILSVGRLHPAKNYPLLVQASSIVIKKCPNAKFILVGEGDERRRIEQAIEKHNVATHWTLLGQRNDVPQLLKAADVFAHPAQWEGFPVVIVEAMAAGTPVIATNVAGIGELLVHEKYGQLIEENNSQSLAEKIVTTIREPQKSTLMAKEAQILVLKHYNLSSWIQAAESIAAKALKKHTS